MHDEDNAIGLSVRNAEGASWTAYGDKCLLDGDDQTNNDLCRKTIQASADEIYEAWVTQRTPLVSEYVVWKYAPTLESAHAGTQKLPPLFTFEDPPKRRVDVENRCDWKYTLDFWYGTTIWQCKSSGKWNYPITQGPCLPR
jgi:hypothetical protein